MFFDRNKCCLLVESNFSMLFAYWVHFRYFPSENSFGLSITNHLQIFCNIY